MEKNLYLKPEISVLLLQTENVLGAPNESLIKCKFNPNDVADPEEEAY